MFLNHKHSYYCFSFLMLFLSVCTFSGCGESESGKATSQEKQYDQKCIEAKTALDNHFFDTAASLLREGAENGHVKSQAYLGVTYMMLDREAEGARWIRKAAEAGDALSQYNLAICYNYGIGVPQSEEVFFWAKKAEENGFENALSTLLLSKRTFQY